MNQFNCIGNLGADPEISTLRDGGKAVRFQIAIEDNYKDSNGDWVDRSQWATFEAFASQAEKIAEWEKGFQVRITARYKNVSYEKDGQKRYKTFFLVVESKLLKKPSPF